MFDTPCVSTPRRSVIVSTSAPSAASSGVRPSFSKICATVRRSAASETITWSFAGTLKRSRIMARSPFCSGAALGAADVAAQDEAQVIAKVWLQSAGPVALARLLPLRRLLHVGRRQMIEGDVLAVAGAAEAASAEHAGHGGERRDVLLVVPLVELGLVLGRDVHRVQQQASGPGRWKLIAREDLIALEAHEALDLRRDPLRPRREVRAADRQVRRARQYLDVFQVVRGDRDLGVSRADPALANEKAGHALALRQVLGVVPVLELVLGRVPDAYRRDQRALCHDRLLPAEDCHAARARAMARPPRARSRAPRHSATPARPADRHASGARGGPPSATGDRQRGMPS